MPFIPYNMILKSCSAFNPDRIGAGHDHGNMNMKQPHLLYHSVCLFVRDIKVSKKFYTKMLGMRVEMDFGKNVILNGGVTLWEIDPHHIIPERLGLDAVRGGQEHRFEFYFETENIEAIHWNMSASGVKCLHPVHEEPWGQRTIRFFDPDGHLIEIGESLVTFVKRLHDGGMSPEIVAEKTHVPLAKVHEILGR